METLTILLVGVLMMASFCIGAKIGQTASRGEPIQLPKPAVIKENRREQQKALEEKQRLDIIMQNIDAYDGTGMGQQDVPR